MSEHDDSRREFLKLAGYVAPAMLTLSVLPREAAAGSNYGPPAPVTLPKNGPPDKKPKKNP